MSLPVNPNIIIFTRPVRTGKTTQLSSWLADKQDAAGILTPDVDGLRKLYDIRTGQYYDLQTDERHAGPAIAVGRFLFDVTIMEKARQLLLTACSEAPSWLVIDEVGKLEIEQQKGLEPAVMQVIRHYQQSKTKSRLLLVIRDSLLAKAIELYSLQDAAILSDELPV